MLNAGTLLSNVCAEWGKLMRARLGFFSAIVVTALLSGGVVYFVQENRIWFLENRIEHLQADRSNNVTADRPYRLTTEQWAKFMEAAKVPPGASYRVFILYNGSCEECAILAQNLINRLRLIPGWMIEGGSGMPDPLQRGVLVKVHSKSQISDEAKTIARALQVAGLNAVITEAPVLGENAMPHLYIGIPE